MIEEKSTSNRAMQLASPLKYTGITFFLAIAASLVIALFFNGTPLVYLLVPINLAYIFTVAWLAKVAYSWFMAIITVLLVVFPAGVFIIMLLAYSRAAKELKELGYKVSFLGDLKSRL
jgi:uncharacterized protein YqhQ